MSICVPPFQNHGPYGSDPVDPLLTTVAGTYLLHPNFYYVPGKGDVFLVLVFRYFFLGQDNQLVKKYRISMKGNP